MNYPVFNPYTPNAMNGYGFNQPIPQYQPQPQFVPQQQTPQTGLNGKMVESFEVFKSADIPMDGNTYYFPKADGTEIYSKRWLQNGTTEQITYKAIKEEMEEKENPMMVKLNGIEEQLTALQEILSKKPVSKKEN